MNADAKIRIGVLAVGLAISVLAGASPVHSVAARVLDEIGGTTQ